MGEVIRKNAAAGDILADGRTTLTLAAARGGDWASTGTARLGPVLDLAATVSSRLAEANGESAPAEEALSVANDVSDRLIQRISDDVWNLVGRPTCDAALDLIFPDRMDLLASGIHPRLDRDQGQAFAHEIRTETALLALFACLALGCGAESLTPAPTSTATPPSSPSAPNSPSIQLLPVVVTAWAADPALAASLERSITPLLTSTCPTRDPGAVVRLHGRTDASGQIEWRADDATDPELGRCLWDPILRRTLAGAGEFDVRASLVVTAAAALPPPSELVTAGGWAGLACTHRESAHCPPDHTCPQYRWVSESCPP